MKQLYVLRDGKAVAIDDPIEWADWFESSIAERQLLLTRLSDRGVEHTQISTAFIAINHNWTGEGPPLLWETAIFYSVPEPENSVRIEGRYATRLEAVAGHHLVVAQLVERIAMSQGQRPEVVETGETSQETN